MGVLVLIYRARLAIQGVVQKIWKNPEVIISSSLTHEKKLGLIWEHEGRRCALILGVLMYLGPSNLEICFSSLLFEKSNEACAFFFFFFLNFRSIFAEKIQKVMFFCCSFFWLLVSLFLHYQILKKKKKFRCGRFSRRARWWETNV